MDEMNLKKNYNPSHNLAADKAMIDFNTHTGYKQCMTGKSTK
jgi:hypothetical protein